MHTDKETEVMEEKIKWIDATNPNLLEEGWYLVETSSMMGWPVQAAFYNPYSTPDYGPHTGWPDFGVDIMGKKITAVKCVHRLDLEKLLKE